MRKAYNFDEDATEMMDFACGAGEFGGQPRVWNGAQPELELNLIREA